MDRKYSGKIENTLCLVFCAVRHQTFRLSVCASNTRGILLVLPASVSVHVCEYVCVGVCCACVSMFI